jgi:hypothetical protein
MAENKHDKAHDLAEQGLEKVIEGERKEGEKLVEEARKLDPEAVQEVAQEVEEDRQQAEKFQK